MRAHAGLRGVPFALALGAFLAAMAHTPLLAGDHGREAPPHWEVGSGVDGTASSGFSYASITLAPFGSSLDDGFRLRAGASSGLYRYEGSRLAEGEEARLRFLGRTTLGA